MLLGFISLLLTVGQGPISNICISKKVGDTWHPCSKKAEAKLNKYPTATQTDESSSSSEDHGRKLLFATAEGARRILAGGGGTDKCAAKVNNMYILFFKYPWKVVYA